MGINIGEPAGQTVSHLHLHVIPRYQGDVADPRGGRPARHPESSQLPRASRRRVGSPPTTTLGLFPRRAALADLPHPRALIAGGDDPLLPHVIAHLDRAVRADLRGRLRPRERLQAPGGTPRRPARPRRAAPAPDRRLPGRHRAQRPAPRPGPPRATSSSGPSFASSKSGQPVRFTRSPTSSTRRDGEGVALVGSSNLSRTALLGGVEWNFRTITIARRGGVRRRRGRLRGAAASPEHACPRCGVDRALPRATVVDSFGARNVRLRRPTRLPRPRPNRTSVQQRALAALEATRADGNSAGLVVLATGLGKTWLSAFDSARPEFRRVLFVAHREEILRQAIATFRRIRPDARLGSLHGPSRRLPMPTCSSPPSRRWAARRTSGTSIRTRSTTSSSTSSTTPRRAPTAS